MLVKNDLQLRQPGLVVTHEVDEDHSGALNDHPDFKSQSWFQVKKKVLQSPVALTVDVKLEQTEKAERSVSFQKLLFEKQSTSEIRT